MTTASTHTTAHPHAQILRTIYADLTTVAHYAADDIVLHRADRTAEDPRVCRGIQAVLAHEQALISLAKNTLTMDVEHIVATEYFGAVLGVLRTRLPRQIAVPFCGLWRFEDGRIVEHWENAYSAAELNQLFTAPSPRPATS